MSASASKGGASPFVWTLIGLVIGAVGGWWYGAWTTYLLLGGLAGWLVGLALATPDDAEH